MQFIKMILIGMLYLLLVIFRGVCDNNRISNAR